MVKRGWRDIIADLLMIAKEPVGKTAIMYRGVFSYTTLLEYLKLTTGSGLLSYDAETHKYQTTLKGLEYLRIYDSITNLVYKKGMQVHERIGTNL